MAMLTIYGPHAVEVQPQQGRGILVDGWGNDCPSYLEDSEVPEIAPFRLPSSRYSDVAYLCSVQITGRTTQVRPRQDKGTLWVRVAITFHNDDGPNTTQRGWMVV